MTSVALMGFALSVAFANGGNDVSKGVATLVGAGIAAGTWLFVLGALAMGLGSYVAGWRVTKTLAGGVADIQPDDGLAANLVTALLVGGASFYGLPVSTTQVAAGAITGMGSRKGRVSWGVAGEMALAWVVTLPITGGLAALTYLLVRRVG